MGLADELMIVDDGWVYFSHTDKYYKEFNMGSSWAHGRTCCQGKCLNGDLASIPDEATMQFIMQNVASTSTWLGGYKDTNGWSWMDGTSWNYTNWKDGHPENKYEDRTATRLIGQSWYETWYDSRDDCVCQCPG